VKFETKVPDFRLELPLLSGETVTLEGPKIQSAAACLEFLSKWAAHDTAFRETIGEKEVRFEVVAKNDDEWLCEMYGRAPGYFMENLSLETIAEIKAYLLQALNNTRKN
jgi:hypothetical protein